MRKLVYYIATTADGFISAEDGSVAAFPMEGPHIADLIADFPETFPKHAWSFLGIEGSANPRFDAVLMGRDTWEVGLPQGIASPYPHLEQHVFSRTLQHLPDPALTLVSSEASAYVRQLKQRPGRDIWLCGGGKLAADLFEEIDELILKINPVVLGRGRPVFARGVPPTPLRPLGRKFYDNGYARLHFAVR